MDRHLTLDRKSLARAAPMFGAAFVCASVIGSVGLDLVDRFTAAIPTLPAISLESLVGDHNAKTAIVAVSAVFALYEAFRHVGLQRRKLDR